MSSQVLFSIEQLAATGKAAFEAPSSMTAVSGADDTTKPELAMEGTEAGSYWSIYQC